MFELAYELMTVAASNPHLIFLFCNLIIVVLILASFQPTSNSDHIITTIPPPSINQNRSFERITPTPEETAANVSIDVHNSSDDSNSSEEEDEDDDDELRRRVEEFINKTNRIWKAEKLNSSLASLTQSTCL
ncbi:uncharacterized protein LOC112525976 [Cynara cardunculus var. scolymus]|uniref:uncharacterized protein LOC112525976 n=1 Tax=Cynara cardunculus var. scolymus TaxID=59895 RepID=UPI000D6296CE|nr:uncharacterized protein LOC112525976 [Cynara cardunculus var. scolymus]